MLELREYNREELFGLVGSNTKESADRKLTRWGIEFTTSGRADTLKYSIINISDPFKVYAITELRCGANTDFQKLRFFYYYYFNDEEFRNLPDEVKEYRLDDKGTTHISRQTMASYTRRLEERNFISRNSGEYYYYFAFKHQQRIVDIKEYNTAWREYWTDKESGCDSLSAICNMIQKHGGVARKQGVPAINALTYAELEYMLDLIQESIENEIK